MGPTHKQHLRAAFLSRPMPLVHLLIFVFEQLSCVQQSCGVIREANNELFMNHFYLTKETHNNNKSSLHSQKRSALSSSFPSRSGKPAFSSLILHHIFLLTICYTDSLLDIGVAELSVQTCISTNDHSGSAAAVATSLAVAIF